MSLSRRAFLGSIGKVAAAHAVPAPVLRLAESFTQVPQALVGTIGSDVVRTVIDRLNDSWISFYDEFNFSNYSFYPLESEGAVHATITGHLSDYLPNLFSAVRDFRKMKSKIVTGDSEVDRNRLHVLRAATEIKKKLYIEDLIHLAALCPDSEKEGTLSVLIDRSMSLEERQKKYGALLPDLQAMDLARRVTDLREDISKLEEFPLFEAKFHLDELMQCALEQGIVSDAFKGASQGRHNNAYAAIEILCRPVGMCAETVDALAGAVPMILADCNSPTLDPEELYELFDDDLLFKSLANVVGDQADGVISGLGWHIRDGDVHEGAREEAINYIKNQFVGTVHNLYRQHFAAVMPDVLDIPVPQLDEAIAEFSEGLALEVEGEGAVASEETASTATLETTSVEAGTEVSELSPALRFAGSNLLQIATNGQTPEGQAEQAPVPTATPLTHLRADIGRDGAAATIAPGP